MPLHVEEQNKGMYLLLTVTGRAESLAELMEYIRTVYVRAVDNDSTKVLLDQRSMETSLDIHELYFMAEEMRDTAVSGVFLRCAVLCAPEKLERMRAVELFLRNRGYTYRVFTNREEALNWLGVE